MESNNINSQTNDCTKRKSLISLNEQNQLKEVKSYFNETIIGKNNCSTTRYFTASVSDLEIDKQIIQLTEPEIETSNMNSLPKVNSYSNFENFKSIYHKDLKLNPIIMNNNRKILQQYKNYKEDLESINYNKKEIILTNNNHLKDSNFNESSITIIESDINTSKGESEGKSEIFKNEKERKIIELMRQQIKTKPVLLNLDTDGIFDPDAPLNDNLFKMLNFDLERTNRKELCENQINIIYNY